MSGAKQTAVVTGANRGIGHEVSRQLASKGWQVIMTGRDEETISAVAKQLLSESLDVVPRVLDVSSAESIQQFVHSLARDFERVDALVNNAGIFLEADREGAESSILKTQVFTIESTLRTNVYGPLQMIQKIVPMMKGRGCIVNVSSGLGQFSDMGGNYPGYRISKVALNAVTRIMAAELAGSQIKVNSVCPGWVRTDMGGSNAVRTVEHGAETIVWCATLPESGPSGRFFRDKHEIPW